MYKNILLIERLLKLNKIWSKSDFLRTAFNIGSLIKAIKTDAAAFIPPESEKKSTDKPRKKLNIKIEA